MLLGRVHNVIFEGPGYLFEDVLEGAINVVKHDNSPFKRG